MLLYQRCLEAVLQAVSLYQVHHSLPMVAMERTYWVLTVPAIWDDQGKAFMRRAAFAAGERAWWAVVRIRMHGSWCEWHAQAW